MSKKSKSPDYEQLGRAVAAVYETGYLDAGRSYKQSFIKGLFQGLGGAIGATLLVALLLWMLSLLGQIPFVNRVADQAHEAIESQSR